MLKILILAAAIGATDGSWGNHGATSHRTQRSENSHRGGDAIVEPAPPPNPGDAFYDNPPPVQECDPCEVPDDIESDQHFGRRNP